VFAGVTGSIHEGGELGYALAHTYGAAFDNPDLIVVCVLSSDNVQIMPLSSCFSARLNRSVKDPVPYSREALRQDLLRVRSAWGDCQTSRARNAICAYLSGVFELVMCGRQKVGPSAGHVGRCGYGISGHPITMSHLPRLSAARATQPGD
jgi:hypothetical protein